MKKLLFILTIGFISMSAIKAQVTDDEIGLVKSILKSEVKVFFAQNVELSTSEAEPFWEIYDQYEAELKPLSNERIDLLKAVIEKEGKQSEEEMDAKIMLLAKIQKKRQALRIKYYKTLKKKLGVKVASQFYQVDTYIYTNITASLNEGLPIIVPTSE